MAPNGLERLEIHYYRVVIGALTGGPPAENDGHVDNTTPEEYGAQGSFPSTNDLSFEKERANMRYEEIIRQVSENISPLQIAEVVATGADEDNPATQFEFTLSYDRFEYLRTEDELNPGIFLEGADALKRWVERALTSEIVSNRFVYKPDDVPTTTIPQGPAIEEITAGPAEAALPIATVTVTQIANVTDTV